MQIEGVVTGEPDDGVVQSEGGRIPIDDDDENDDDVWSSIKFISFLFLEINVICFSNGLFEVMNSSKLSVKRDIFCP